MVLLFLAELFMIKNRLFPERETRIRTKKYESRFPGSASGYRHPQFAGHHRDPGSGPEKEADAFFPLAPDSGIHHAGPGDDPLSVDNIIEVKRQASRRTQPMKATVFKCMLAGFVFFLFFGSGFLLGHGPETITLEFETSTGTLSVDVRHPVNNPENHYIKKIQISLNGKMVQEENYTSQKTTQGHTDAFILEMAKAGDQITVSAICSKFGSKKAQIKVT